MLTHIYIKNFAIIREIDLDLQEKLNIISGETGTGKSIVIQAISMALGSRGSSSIIGSDSSKALVQLVFSLDSVLLEKIRACSDISRFAEDSPEELIIGREFSRNGKSLARINGEIVTLSVLSQLADLLIDIHGQYDNQTFLNPDRHMDILDNAGGRELLETRDQYTGLWQQYHSIRSELMKLRSEKAGFLRRQDYLRFELNEIDAAELKKDEDTQLENELKILQNSEKISSSLSESYEILESAGLDRCRTLLEGISGISQEYSSLSKTADEGIYLLSDLKEDIRRARDSFTFDPEDINRIMNRLSLIDGLKRKYGGSIELILEYADKCRAELETFMDSDEKENQLTKELSGLKKQLMSLADQLSLLRRSTAESFSAAMTAQLAELNFANAVFEVRVGANVNAEGNPSLSASGADTVSFLFNANKGGSLKPLSEVASGGEISRIALAFMCMEKEAGQVHTLIFDEIDTGISGITASVVGRKLHEISDRHQVLCITHLPQIAACGDHQYLISRDDSSDRSYTTISHLSDEERIKEIARLLGGANITETTLASASELLGYSRR